jgi:hypothetical protein
MTHSLPGTRRPAIHQIRSGGVGIRRRDPLIAKPIPCDARLNDIAVFGKADGRLQQFVEATRPMVFDQSRPRSDGAGNHHRMRRILRDVDAALPIPFGMRGGRGAPRSVKRDGNGPALRCKQRKAIATDAGHQGIGDALNRSSRYPRIDRVATRTQYVYSDKCRKRMRRGGRGVRRIHRRPPRQKEITQRKLPIWRKASPACSVPNEPGQLERTSPVVDAKFTRGFEAVRGRVERPLDI